QYGRAAVRFSRIHVRSRSRKLRVSGPVFRRLAESQKPVQRLIKLPQFGKVPRGEVRTRTGRGAEIIAMSWCYSSADAKVLLSLCLPSQPGVESWFAFEEVRDAIAKARRLCGNFAVFCAAGHARSNSCV